MKTSGIYQIINTLTKDIYIGSSIHIEKRFNAHKRALTLGKHHSIYLQRAWDRYGSDTFEFEIIEITDKCLEREQFYLETQHPAYNSAKHALAPMAYRTHTPETKEKMSRVHKGNKYNLGRKATKAQRAARSLLRKKFRWSDEVKMKMSETAKRLNRGDSLQPYIELLKKKIIDSEGNHFNSATECAKFWKISRATVCDILKGRHKQTRKKVSFKYA